MNLYEILLDGQSASNPWKVIAEDMPQALEKLFNSHFKHSKPSVQSITCRGAVII